MSRIDIFDLDSGYKVSRYIDTAAGAGIWATPTIPTGWRIAHHRLVVINGGEGGGYIVQGPNTRSGGIHSKEVRTLPSTVSYVVGAGGAGSTTKNALGSPGGASSIGNVGDPWYIVGNANVGIIETEQGVVASAATPGIGGMSGAVVGNTILAGTSGTDSAGGLGGQAATSSAPAGAGGNANLDQFEISGGGGGGGGAGFSGTTAPGGNGGTPGGGGGCGGTTYATLGAPYGPGGNGGPGAVAIYTYMLPADMGGTV